MEDLVSFHSQTIIAVITADTDESTNRKIKDNERNVAEYFKKVDDLKESERETMIDVTREAPIVTMPDPVAPSVRPPTA